MPVVLDQQDPFALAQWGDDLTSEPEYGGLVGRAVSHDERSATLGQPVHDLTQRQAEQPRLPVDQVRIDPPDGFEIGVLPRCLGRCTPPVLHRGSKPSRFCDWRVTLIRGTPKYLHHLGGSRRATGDECHVWRVQSESADLLGIRDPLRRQAITIVVGVPTQLDVPHEPSLRRGSVGMKAAKGLVWNQVGNRRVRGGGPAVRAAISARYDSVPV